MKSINNVNDLKKMFLQSELKVRDSQLEMTLQVKEALLNNEKLVIEAPTATGKSFAYLIGALAANKDRKEKLTIIISTATVALQEQLFNKDIPFLEKLISEKLNYKLAKGRARYLCNRKFSNINIKNSKVQSEVRLLQSELDDNWSGDIDELQNEPDKNIWPSLTSTSTSCSGKRCEFYQECAFYSARRNLRKAEIVVVNHNLLLSHLALGDGSILPKFEKSIFIIDECHHLPKKALSAFAAQATVIGSQSWINDLDKLLNGIPSKAIKDGIRDRISRTKKRLISELSHAQKVLDAIYQNEFKPDKKSAYQDSFFRLTKDYEELSATAINIRLNAEIIFNTLVKVNESLDDFAESSTIHTHQTLDRTFSQLGFIVERSSNLFNLWSLIIDKGEPPIAKWIEPHQKEKESIFQLDEIKEDLFTSNLQDYMVSASPIEVGHLLDRLFWSQAHNGIILCSATIRSLGKFDRFMHSSGLHDTATSVALPSPLDYKKSQFIVPKMVVTPQQADDHIKESSKLLSNYLSQNKNGSLVLFTSNKAMHKTYDLLPKALQSITLKQGDYAKHLIISKHKNKIGKNKSSIIFGLDSFSEGLDLPGELLELLIIHKLPFSVPNDPIEKTRSDWLTSIGKNSFVEISLPDASLKLTQMCGRLIRREEDRGKIFVLDSRLTSKYYGKQMLNNLPEFNFTQK
ncbi:ATP-dependent DNA helicase DinG [Thiotrichales bacterium 19S11-10]|nr:ATP-dependent DNA helicase DinG [Thiotrichales bacterium 19S11-10]